MAGAAIRTSRSAAPGNGSVPVTVLVDGSAAEGRELWHLAEEVPVNLAYNGRPHVVMMATPADLEDFARGFSLSEGVLASNRLIRGIEVDAVEGGIRINVATPSKTEVSRERQARSLEGRSGCGICGMERLDQVVRNVRPVKAGFDLDVAAVAQAFEALPGRQVMNKRNRSVHAAAWCAPTGKIEMIREDVGRHTALDKLIGAMAAAEVDPSQGFIAMTSRCSFELVQKASSVGVPMLATVSAPTSLALDLAGRAGMVLASLAGDRVVLFESPEPAGAPG